MKREYQIRALIDEGGNMRAAQEGETLAEFEARKKAEETAADLLTIEERNRLWDALKRAEDDCNAVRLCLGLTTLTASAVLLDVAAKSLADAQAIIDAAEERAENREDWQ